MYAHQVIEAVRKYAAMGSFMKKRAAQYHKTLCAMEDSIVSAQHFHLPKARETNDIFEKLRGTNLTAPSDYTIYMRLPYKECWFDWEHDVPLIDRGADPCRKRAVLASEIIPDLLCCYVFACFREKGWLLRPNFYLTSIGKTIEESAASNDFHCKFSQADADFFTKLETQGANEYVLPFNLTGMQEEMVWKVFHEDEETLCHMLLSLILLHAKNVGTKHVEAPSRLNRKRSQKNLVPLFSYKTLVVSVPGGPNKPTNVAYGGKNRLHLCRRHLKCYTAEAPLFGKYQGLYWWDAHVRGRAKGFVHKDYEVRPS